jgi:transposase-like protein
MKTFMIPSGDKKRIVKDYLNKGLSQQEIASILGISKQLVRYWVKKIKESDNFHSGSQ